MTRPERYAFEDFSIESDQRAARTARGMIATRRVLASKGIAPPIDSKHADFYDPPLSIAEQRHGHHVRQHHPVEGCRFCDAEKEGPDEATEASTSA